MRIMKESPATHTELGHAGEAVRTSAGEAVRTNVGAATSDALSRGADAAASVIREIDATARIREGKKISMQVPEPVLVTEEAPAPVEKRVRVLRPEAGMGRGKMYPCVVDSEMLRPARK